MADFATLVLAADTTRLKSAVNDLKAVSSAGATTEAGVKRSMKGVETAVGSVPAATKKAAAGLNELRMSLDPVYAASKQYEAAQKQVSAAVRAGTATQLEANKVMALAEARYLGVGSAAKTSNAAVGAAATGMNSFAFQSRMAAMQLSQVAQQTMAGGGFIRALAIQLPDLALGFGAVGIAAGVAAGIALPLLANFLTGADNAKELETALDDLTGAAEQYMSASQMARNTTSQLAIEFGSLAEEAGRAYRIIEGLNYARVLDGLNAVTAGLNAAGLEDFVAIIREGPAELEVLNDTYNKALSGLREEFGLTGEQALMLVEKLNIIKTAEGPKELVQAADQLNQYLISAFGSAENIPPQLAEMVQRLAEAQTVAARVSANLDGSADAAVGAANAAANLSGQLSVASQYAAQLAANLAQAPAGIQAFQNRAAQLTAQISAINSGMGQIKAGAAGLRVELEQRYGLADAANAAEEAYISGLINRQVQEYENVQNLNKVYTDKVTALNKVGKTAGGSAAKGLKAAQREAEALAKEIERLEFNADPLKKYNYELERLNVLAANGLSDGAYRKAVQDLTDEFANANPAVGKVADAIGDFVASGLRDFKSLLGAFKNMLREMISTAIANPIRLALIGGASGGAVPSLPGQPGGGGLLSGLFGKAFGSFGSGGSIFGLGGLAGGKGLLGGLGNAVSGGLGNIFSIGANASAAGGGIMATLGAAAPVIGIAAAAISFFKKKVTELDRGINVTVDSMDAMIEGYKKINTKRFWGLSSKDSFEPFDGYDEGIPAMVKAVNEVQTGIMDAAAALGVGADAFEGFSYSFQSSFKDMTDDQIQAELTAKFRQLGHDFAVLIPGLEGMTKEGELASDTLYTLVNSLNSVNTIFDALGFSMVEASLQGAALAQTFVNVFGSIENANAATTAYYNRFYSDTERAVNAFEGVRKAMADLGVVMPYTIEGFRALVEQAERMGDLERAGRLIALSNSFASVIDARDANREAQVQQAQQDLQSAFAREMQMTRDSFAADIAGLQNRLTDAREKVANSRAIANALSDALSGRVFPSIGAQRQYQDQGASYLRSVLGMSRIDDSDALQDALRAVSDPSADTYETLEEYRRDFLLTTGVIRQLEQKAGFALSEDEKMVSLLENQIADMQAQSDAQVDLLQSQLDALLGIKEALSLEQAMANFANVNGAPSGVSGAMTTAAFGSTTNLGQFADASNARAIQGIYQEVLGRNADAAGLQYYVDLARDSMSIPAIRDLIASSTEAATGIIPSYDTGTSYHPGGLAYVHKDEMLNLPRGTSVSTTAQTSRMLDNSELVAELRQMRAELKQLVGQGETNSIYIKRTSDSTEYLANDRKVSA